jgi:hypothetical protein
MAWQPYARFMRSPATAAGHFGAGPKPAPAKAGVSSIKTRCVGSSAGWAANEDLPPFGYAGEILLGGAEALFLSRYSLP